MAAIKMEGTQNNYSYHIHRAERNECKLAHLRSSRPGLLCTVAIKTLTKRTWRGKRLFALKVPVPLQGEPRQELEAEAMQECCLPACFPWLAQFPFSKWTH